MRPIFRRRPQAFNGRKRILRLEFKPIAVVFRYSYVTRMERTRPDIFDALADPTRRDILTLLRGRSMAAGEIARRFPQRRPAISKHLALLKRTGLLREQRERQRRIYAIAPEGLEPVIRLMTRLHSQVRRDPTVGPAKRAPARTLQPRPPRRSVPVLDLETD